MVRGIEEFLMDLASDPEYPAIGRLLEVCYRSHLAVHRALINAGAHFTSMGDSLGGPDVISPEMFDRFARPFEERLVKDLAADGIFTVIHICGDTSRILGYLEGYDFCGFELDYKTDAVRAKSTAGARHVLFGNIDPSGVIARGSPAFVRQKTGQLVSLWKPGGLFVLNAGCAIPANTPEENIRALIATVRAEGVYE
jgi:MtaA/CmuA family methyltransferase